MAGALMQLVAYGAQDVYLTADPTITFWKAVYRRYTNFAMESMEQTFSGLANFGNKAVCRISRNGDLMYHTYVRAVMPALAANRFETVSWVNRVGFRLLRSVELRVGGQMIDRHYSTWMHIWTELTHTFDKKRLLDQMVGGEYQTPAQLPFNNVTGGQNAWPQTLGNVHNPLNNIGNATQPIILNIPLLFSFCRNPGLALPLIALQYHEVEIHIEFETFDNCVQTLPLFAPALDNIDANANLIGIPTAAPGVNDNYYQRDAGVTLWVDYVFLDTEERKEFAQKPHEYLIEVTQSQSSVVQNNSINSIRLTFNHPTKFLAWVVRAGEATSTGVQALLNGAQPFNPWCLVDNFTGFTDPLGNNLVKAAQIKLNGQDRFQTRSSEYFDQVQPYQHFTGCPQSGVNVYSFAIKPEDHQPSGTCNFSRIDNVNLNLTLIDLGGDARNGYPAVLVPSEVHIYAFSYNVFRVASGMGGLAYSN